MDKNTKLKEFVTSLNSILENIQGLKNSLDGGKAMTDLEKSELEAKEKAEAEAKAAEDAKLKAEADAKELADKAAAEELAKKEAEDKERAEAELKEKEEAEAKLALAEAEKVKLEVAEAAKKEVKKTWSDKMKKAMCSEDLDGLELSEAHVALATKYSFVDLVKLAADLTVQMAAFTEEKRKAEANLVAETRFEELNVAGIAFAGDKATLQKEKIAKMDEKAFASYKEDLVSIKEVSKGSSEDEIEAARKKAGSKGVAANLQLEDKYKNYSLLK